MYQFIYKGMGESSSRNYVFFDFFFKFLNFCDVRRKGWDYAHIWEMGVSMALYGDAATPRVFGFTKMSPSLLLLILVKMHGNVYIYYPI
jgi:hypothetical protein